MLKYNKKENEFVGIVTETWSDETCSLTKTTFLDSKRTELKFAPNKKDILFPDVNIASEVIVEMPSFFSREEMNKSVALGNKVWDFFENEEIKKILDEYKEQVLARRKKRL